MTIKDGRMVRDGIWLSMGAAFNALVFLWLAMEVTLQVRERWLPHAHFSHAKHETVSSCRECHVAAQSSRLTSDVLMPAKESCVRCHSPTGQARKASECSTCHLYHSPDQPNTPATRASTISLKQMLLGTSRSGVRDTSP